MTNYDAYLEVDRCIIKLIDHVNCIRLQALPVSATLSTAMKCFNCHEVFLIRAFQPFFLSQTIVNRKLLCARWHANLGIKIDPPTPRKGLMVASTPLPEINCKKRKQWLEEVKKQPSFFHKI